MELNEGQVAVITGGASGIGLALAEALGARGLAVVIADIQQDTLDAAAETLSASGIDVLAVRCDVTSEQSVNDLADASFGWKGHVDVVCNNAGVVHFGPAFEDLDSWRWVIDVDMWGVIYGCLAFTPRMLESGRPGHIVNTASTAGILGFSRIASYVAAKHAVVGMSQSMYFELEPTDVGISVLCPGVVTTNINTSERNRPGTDPTSVELQPFGTDRTEAMTPAQVSDIVIAAIEADQFWILPHEHYGELALEVAQRRVEKLPPLMGKTR